MQRLLTRAAHEQSSAVLILRHGKLVVEEYFGNGIVRINTWSLSGSIISLAIGTLIDKGRIQSIDDPVVQYLPRDGRYTAFMRDPLKRHITLRHLLTNTSGLSAPSGRAQQDSIAHRVGATSARFPPGTVFAESSEAIEILGVIVESIAGMSLSSYVREKVLTPTGIADTDASWAQHGREASSASFGLALRPRALVRIGQLMLQHGTWRGHTVVSEQWVQRLVQPSQSLDETYGLLWKRVPQKVLYGISATDSATFASYGLMPSQIEPLRTLAGFKTRASLNDALSARLGEVTWSKLRNAMNRDYVSIGTVTSLGELRAYLALGTFGQDLVVVPSASIVAVRMCSVALNDVAGPRCHNPEDDSFFVHDVLALADGIPHAQAWRSETAPASLEDVPPLSPPEAPGWEARGNASHSLWASADSAHRRNGHATTLLSLDYEADDESARWTRVIDARELRGTRVRASATIMTARGASASQELWIAYFRADGELAEEQVVRLPPVAGWTNYAVDLDIATDASRLEYGLRMQHATGAVWLDEPRLDTTQVAP